MTDQEINAAIEREVGNQPCGLHGTYDCACGLLVRNYIADLNAMHDAENVLTPLQLSEMVCLIHAMHKCGGPLTFDAALLHATARQRAEAFLRTIGKWKE